MDVGVQCYTAAGAPIDWYYTMSFALNRNLLGTGNGYGYAWADQPTSSSYTPAKFYSKTKPKGPTTITRTGVGAYTVTFAAVGTAVKSDVQVTAYARRLQRVPRGRVVHQRDRTGRQRPLPRHERRPGGHLLHGPVHPLTRTPPGLRHGEGGIRTSSRGSVGRTRDHAAAFANGCATHTRGVAWRRRADHGSRPVPAPDLAQDGEPRQQGEHMNSTVGAGARRTLAVMAAVATADGDPEAAQAAAAYGYVWADQPTTASYTPAASSQANSTGALNTIVRSGAGIYIVTFPGLARATNGGTVNVTAYRAGGIYCGVRSWGMNGGGGIVVIVLCTAPNGTTADAHFDATYTVPKARGKMGYVYAENPTSASYTPAAFYQFNSTGGVNTIRRFGTGSYVVTLPGLAASGNGGTVKVTAYGVSAVRCKVTSWGSNGTGGIDVGVQCYTAAGAPIDGYYTMSFALNRNLLGTGNGYGYAWPTSPPRARTRPLPSTRRRSPRARRRSRATASAACTVTFAVGTAVKSNVQVTAYGGGSAPMLRVRVGRQRDRTGRHHPLQRHDRQARGHLLHGPAHPPSRATPRGGEGGIRTLDKG